MAAPLSPKASGVFPSQNFTEEVAVASVIEKDAENGISQPVEERTAQVAAEALASILPVIPGVADEPPRGSLAVIPAPSLSASSGKPVRTIREDMYKRYVVPGLVERYKRDSARLKECRENFNTAKKEHEELEGQLKQKWQQLEQLKKEGERFLRKLTGYKQCLLPSDLPQEDLAEPQPGIERPSAEEEAASGKRPRPVDEVLPPPSKEARLSPNEIRTRTFRNANSKGQFYHLNQPVEFIKFVGEDQAVVKSGEGEREVPRSECTWIPNKEQKILTSMGPVYLFREIVKVNSLLDRLKDPAKGPRTRRATLFCRTEKEETSRFFVCRMEDALPVGPEDQEVLKLFTTQDNFYYRWVTPQ